MVDYNTYLHYTPNVNTKGVTFPTHVTLYSSDDERFHDEFGLRNAISLEGALLLVGFLICKIQY